METGCRDKAADRKILVVGCGGLGCELVKILVHSPLNRLTLVDDDTVDPTNLNRQFFFTAESVGKSKAEVLRDQVVRMTGSECSCIAGRIDQFKTIDFYRGFDVVFNCLDNDATRSFVNQRCNAAGVRMVDGGSAGWLGQSFCSGKECFDCLPKQQDRTYPVCTIRQRPKTFEHCLVWAKAIVEGGGYGEEDAQTSTARDQIGRILSESQDPVVAMHCLAVVRAGQFNIETFDFIDTQTFLKRIIPSVCTTNSIVAALMILSDQKQCNYFVVQGKSLIIRTELTTRRDDCLVCACPMYSVVCAETDTVATLLDRFHGDSLVSETSFYDRGSACLLSEFDGEFLICVKNEMKNRIYIEGRGAFSMRRIK